MKQLPSLLKRNLVLILVVLVPWMAQAQFRGKILTHPANVTECEGYVTVAYRVVMAKSIYGYTYQWQMAPYKSTKFIAVSEATHGIVDGSSSILTLKFDKISGLGLLTQKTWDRMQFRCVVRENLKLTDPEISNVAYLIVQTAPSITKNPVSAEKNAGESVSFSISSSGSSPRTYQWQFNDGGAYSNIPGATSSVYTIPSVTTDDAGSYRCRVTNPCNTRTSTGATLTVNETFYEAWVAQPSGTSDDIKKVSFTSSFNGWAVAYDQDKLLHTTNGGTDWSATGTGVGSYYWYAIEFINSNLGFVGGSYNIARTENGGSNWERYSFRDSLSISEYPYVYDFFFYDANTGWAVGTDGLVLKTSDGGDSWILQNYDATPTPYMDVTLNAVYFVDALNGWVVGANGVIFKTSNGGSDWTEQTKVNTNDLYDVVFTDANNGMAVGGTRNIIYTTNGGTNWYQVSQTGLPYFYPYAVHFVNSTDGWIVGHKWVSSVSVPVIIRTNDGGSTWHEQHTEGGDALKDITFVDSENGWAIGSTGTILRTGTGGCFLPTVNLFGNEALCASESYTMYADTFAKNLNCSYLWSTGATSGQLTVSESDDYSVTVTSLCGETAEDSKTLEFYPLPPADAGTDTFMCFGDTIQLNADGGVIFDWSPSGTLSDPGIQNPLAYPTGTTVFYVSVTDTNGCSAIDNMTLTVNPIPTSSFSSPAFVCGTDEAAINYTGSAGGGATYIWDFDGGTDSPNGSTHNVSWADTGTKTIVLVVVENTCGSDTTRSDISVNPVPESTFSLPAAVCGSDGIDVNYEGSASGLAIFDWNFDGADVISGDPAGPGPITLSWGTQGTKNLNLNVSDLGCVAELTEKEIVVSYPYDGQTICLVTLDLETGKNAIIWEKSDSTAVEFYHIYRQSSTGETYDLLETMVVDTLSYYVDMTSEPATKSHKYKIAVFDTCGNESELSLYHKTMLLTTNLGPSSINLAWTEYVVEETGFGFENYVIYRGPAPDKVAPFDTIPTDNTLYPDNNPMPGNNYYLVAGIIADECSPSGRFKAGTGPYKHSLSNMDDNKLKETSVEDMLSGVTNLRVYPNPFSEKVNVEYSLKRSSNVKIEVYNLLGVRVLEVENSRQTPGVHNYSIKTEELDGSSIYYLRFSVNNSSSVIKLVPAY